MIIEIGISQYVQPDVTAYKESSVRYFESAELAAVYRQFLEQKVQREMPGASVYWFEIQTESSFDYDEAIRLDALAKLTDEEKKILGLD